MRRWHWGVAGVVAAGIAVAGIVAVRHGDGDDEATPVALPTQRVYPAVVATRPAPADGALTVTEQGFAQHDETTGMTFTPGYGPGNPEPYKPVYAAFTLRNTSTADIARPAVKVTYYDARNKAIAAKDSSWTYTAPVMPGASATYAAFLSIDSVTVTRMTVALTAVTWYSAADAAANKTYAAITAGDVKVLPAAVKGTTTITYTATNALAKPMYAIGTAVFRDGNGKLLGARMHDGLGQDPLAYPPGESTGSLSFDTWFPPGTDRSRLQVTLRPGLAAADR